MDFVWGFYKDLKKAMPTLMSYRYYATYFNDMYNGGNKLVTNYTDTEGNNTIIKPIPIMSADVMSDTFTGSFGVGQFGGGQNFSYSHCIIDLNPNANKTEYQDILDSRYCYPEEWHTDNNELNVFPMKFASGVNVNANDEYKKSKLVLTRIPNISGEYISQFVMGSQSTDYLEITDKLKLKYKDGESITSNSPGMKYNVKLTNGGAYQKNGHPVSDSNKDGEDGLYKEITWTDNSIWDKLDIYKDVDERQKKFDAYKSRIKGKPKYYKNHHLFIDPFELTIAQWCYAHMWNTQG